MNFKYTCPICHKLNDRSASFPITFGSEIGTRTFGRRCRVFPCAAVELAVVEDHRGNLTVAPKKKTLPSKVDLTPDPNYRPDIVSLYFNKT